MSHTFLLLFTCVRSDLCRYIDANPAVLCPQEIAGLRVQLEKVHLKEREKEEGELVAAQGRKAAIEDLEKGVSCIAAS